LAELLLDKRHLCETLLKATHQHGFGLPTAAHYPKEVQKGSHHLDSNRLWPVVWQHHVLGGCDSSLHLRFASRRLQCLQVSLPLWPVRQTPLLLSTGYLFLLLRFQIRPQKNYFTGYRHRHIEPEWSCFRSFFAMPVKICRLPTLWGGSLRLEGQFWQLQTKALHCLKASKPNRLQVNADNGTSSIAEM
jgi:hypothetical protein